MWDDWVIEASLAAEMTVVTTPLAFAIAFAARRSLSRFSQTIAWTLCVLALAGTLWFWRLMGLFGGMS